MNGYAILSGTLAVVLGISLVPVLRCRRTLSQTTLAHAWRWAFAAVVAWTVLAAMRPQLAATRWESHLYYLSSMLAMCPFVAMLGARRPGERVWNAVVVALLLVLALPCLQASFAPLGRRDVRLDEAWSLFVTCVLAVGLLNYLPTRYAPAAALYGVAQVSQLAPLSVWSWLGQGGWETQGNLASVAMAAAIWVARFRAVEPIGTRAPEDRLWVAFRDLYGLVWGRRQQDRFNAVAEREGWPVRLAWMGMRRTTSPAQTSLDASLQQNVVETLRYQLRRFVATEWIDEQLEV